MKRLSELDTQGLKLICGADAEVENIAYAKDDASLYCGASMIIINETVFHSNVSYEFFKALAAKGTRALLVVGLNVSEPIEYAAAADLAGISVAAAKQNVTLLELAQSLAVKLWNIPQPDKSNNESITDLIDEPDIESVLKKLAVCAGTACAYRDLLKVRTYHSDASQSFIEKVKTYPYKEISRLFYTSPIYGDGIEYGHLIFELPPSCSKNMINAALLGLKFIARKDLLQRINEKMRLTKLFEELREGNIREQNELIHRLRSVGIRKDGTCAVMLFESSIAVKESEHNRVNIVLDTLKKTISPYFEEVYFYIKERLIIGLFMPGDSSGIKYINDSFEKAAKSVTEELLRLLPSAAVYCSQGEQRCSLTELGQSFNTALYALKYAKLRSLSGTIVKWDDLGSFKILNEIAVGREATHFCESKLRQLRKFDDLHGGSLLVTLAELYANNWNFQQTAKAMSYHLNTIKYRYRKMCEILETDIENDCELRFDLHLALKLKEICDISQKGEKENGGKNV